MYNMWFIDVLEFQNGKFIHSWNMILMSNPFVVNEKLGVVISAITYNDTDKSL